jgi:serine/threonine protein kinase
VLPANPSPFAEGNRTWTFQCCCESVVNLMKHVVSQLPDDRELTPIESMSVLAEDPQLRRALCTVKACKHGMELTCAELEALRSLQDPHLITVCVWDEDGSRPRWFATDYFAQGTLHTHLADYRGDPVRAARLLLPLATLLGQMHERGLTHRDVQTKNIFVDDDGELVLGEFGAPPAPNRHSATCELARSADYTPRWPEPELSAPARDVYMLAQVLSAMVAGSEHHIDFAAPSPADPSGELVRMFPEDPRMKLVVDFLRAHVTQTAAACQSMNGAELAIRVKRLIDSLTTLVGTPCEGAVRPPDLSEQASPTASR